MPSAIREPSEYHILDQPHSKRCRMKIIHVGAGAAGLLTAYKAKKSLTDYELMCYEKNPSVGGTWLENRYPGCACDIPAHTYTYSFEPNTEWSGFYSYSDEILQYFERFYKKYELAPYFRFNTEVVCATWLDETSEWLIQLKRSDGTTFTDTCHVLVNGTGVVNKWKWPNIQGLHDFNGVLAHSANWDPSIDWTEKNVAVIGTGSSSIQMVPEFARGARSVTVFMRNSSWISDPFAIEVAGKQENQDLSSAKARHTYSEEEKESFRNDPESHLEYRKRLESAVVSTFPMFYRGSELNKKAKDTMRARMLERIGDGFEELKRRLIPDWSPGCRRLTPGEGYLEALTKPNVKAVYGEIATVTPTGMTTVTGEHYDFDIIACATGFDVQFVPHFKIIGRHGRVIREDWKETPNCYASLAAPGYPNYFMINGPRGNWGQGCSLPSHEVQVDYILQVVQKMQEDRIKQLEPKETATTQLNEHMDLWHNTYSVWSEPCRSWYKDNKPDGRVYIWSGSMLHLLKTLKRPRFEHFDIEYKDENMWAFLGHGLTKLELEKKGLNLAPHIRNEDTAWEID